MPTLFSYFAFSVARFPSLYVPLLLPLQYPRSVPTAGGISYMIASVRDQNTGFDSANPDGVARLPVSRDGEWITFTLHNGIVVTLRTSGTEPKLKYYVEYCGKPGDNR